MILFDSIIHGLQKFGGISNYWQTLAETTHFAGDVQFLLPKNIRGDVGYLSNKSVVFDNRPVSIARYLNYRASRDIQVAHSSYYRLPNRRDLASVVTCYDFVYEQYRSGAAAAVHRLQKFKALRECDHIVAISYNTKNDILKYLPDLKEEKISVVHIPVEPDGLAREQVGEYDNRVIFSGSRLGYKRFDIAVEAVAALRNLSLDIIGPPLSERESGYLQHHLPGRYSYFEAKSNAEVLDRMEGAYAFIFPSDYEGFGLPILEAFHAGVPVVCADRSSFPEIVGESALLSPSQSPRAYSELLESLDMHSVRSALVKSAARRKLLFSKSDFYHKMSKIYGSL